jgi:hypothetical protein
MVADSSPNHTSIASWNHGRPIEWTVCMVTDPPVAGGSSTWRS